MSSRTDADEHGFNADGAQARAMDAGTLNPAPPTYPGGTR